MRQLSDFALVQLDQFKAGDVEAGDLISKCGRTELQNRGLVTYRRGKWGLTASGARLAARVCGQIGRA